MDICIGFGLRTEKLCDPSPTLCAVVFSSPPHFASSPPPYAAAAAAYTFRPFSAAGGGNGDNADGKGGKLESWRFSADHPDHCFFGSDGSDLSGISNDPAEDAAPKEKSRGMCSGMSTRSLRWAAVGRTMTGFDGDSEEVEKVFDMGVSVPGSIEDFKGELSAEREEEKLVVDAALEEEKELGIVLKGSAASILVVIVRQNPCC